MTMGDVRVRFAPSPTGSLHIGGARTALFNWLYARRTGGRFVLRIEDTDLKRSREESSLWIADALHWLGLDWDEGPGKDGPLGPYFQSQRLDLYHAAADKLLAEGRAYRCYCTPAELEARREAARAAGQAPRYDGRCRDLTAAEAERLAAEGRRPAVRLRVPTFGQTVVTDLVRGEVTFENAVLDDLVIVKSDGMPTYNFACVIDDAGMQISHVLRAEEHLSNTPKQMHLYAALGYELPQFAHVPMILAPDRAKLSKRHGATSVEEFREQGFLPEALVNYLAFLGWSGEGEREIYTLEELARVFSLERVARTAAIYDVGKLTWLNGHYLRAGEPGRIARLALPFLAARGLVPAAPAPDEMRHIERVVDAVRSRVRTLAEVAGAASYFFRPLESYDDKGWRKYLARPGAADLLAQAREALAAVEPFTAAATEAAYRALVERLQIPSGDLFHATRVAVSGRTMGPGLFDIIELLGRDETLRRLAEAERRVRSGTGGVGGAGGAGD